MGDEELIGSLAYEVIARYEQAEEDLRAFDARWQNHTINVTFAVDQSQLDALNERLQSGVQPIRITLDTSGAEAQLASLGIGGVGGAPGAPGVEPYEINGPYELAGGGARGPSHQADPYTSWADRVTLPESAATPPPLPANAADDEEDDEGPVGGRGGGGRRGIGSRFFFRAMHLIGAAYRSYESYEDIDRQMGYSGDSLATYRDVMQRVRMQEGGFGGIVGLGEKGLYLQSKAQDEGGVTGFLATSPLSVLLNRMGYTTDTLDADKRKQDEEEQERKAKEEAEKLHKQQEMNRLESRLGLFTNDPANYGEAQRDAAALRRARLNPDDRVTAETQEIDDHLAEQIANVHKQADQWRELGGDLKQINQYVADATATLTQTADARKEWIARTEDNRAADYEGATAVAALRAQGRFREADDLERANRRESGLQDAPDEAEFNRRAARFDAEDAAQRYKDEEAGRSLDASIRSEELKLAGKPFDAEIADLEEKQRKALETAAPQNVERLKRLFGDDIAGVRQKQQIDAIQHDRALDDQVRELDAYNAEVGRGDRQYAGQFSRVQSILDRTNREADSQLILGRGDRAGEYERLGVAQLQQLQAELTAGTRSTQVDPLYSNLSNNQGSGRVEDLLTQIKTAIDNLQVRITAGK